MYLPFSPISAIRVQGDSAGAGRPQGAALWSGCSETPGHALPLPPAFLKAAPDPFFRVMNMIYWSGAKIGQKIKEEKILGGGATILTGNFLLCVRAGPKGLSSRDSIEALSN